MSIHVMHTLARKIALGILRLVQLVLACAVIGLYGKYLARASEVHERADGRWVWAVVVASLSAITSIIYSLPFFPLRFFWIWDILLFIFWLTVFGIFAKLFMKEDPEGNHDIEQMRDAMWLDLVNWLLWLVSAVVGGWYFWRYKNQRTTLTGRGMENKA
ncbi:hypothetical protein H072_7434 [Dactylellina haptotyla CBS 200.50]|uniref:MARVEL domain-containing protein n=1 Tax=Dactylellina haptotyla (strain CBS 200.50) TaxID=1284197 RepID=S8ACM6_DACHA|nr:hypothetical protein H072_7434 [Dactylellina haptotyla CBS 200.50]